MYARRTSKIVPRQQYELKVTKTSKMVLTHQVLI